MREQGGAQYSEDQSLPATTTAQEDIVSAGQRRVSLIWETTQAVIAVGITGAIIYSSVAQIESQVVINAFFLIIGSYFSRTNHSKIGGVGHKPTDDQPYKGR